MTIKMPYGGVISWSLGGSKSVHQPRVNHGYRHLVAYRVHSGSHAQYIADECQKAREAGAPKDAIHAEAGRLSADFRDDVPLIQQLRALNAWAEHKENA